MTGDWRCGLCPETGSGGLDGLEEHYMRHHYLPPMRTYVLSKRSR